MLKMWNNKMWSGKMWNDKNWNVKYEEKLIVKYEENLKCEIW